MVCRMPENKIRERIDIARKMPGSKMNEYRTLGDKMKAAIICSVLSLASAGVHADASQQQFLSEFVSGQYQLIGKGPDSDRTYSGQVGIFSESGKLRFLRVIAGNTVSGEAAIEEAVHGEANVLRMRFNENGVDYEDTCLIQSDLDNYARISCYLYRQDGTTREPGIEALFIRKSR